MVICVALYRGPQIFAGSFGGKCLDQCKHGRPQRNPRGSKGPFKKPRSVLPSLPGSLGHGTLVSLHEPAGKTGKGPRRAKDPDFTPTASVFPDRDGAKPQEPWLPGLAPLLTCWVTWRSLRLLSALVLFVLKAT